MNVKEELKISFCSCCKYERFCPYLTIFTETSIFPVFRDGDICKTDVTLFYLVSHQADGCYGALERASKL